MSEDNKEPEYFLGKPIPRSFEEGLGDLAKKRGRTEQSPLVINMRKMLEEVNEATLKGEGKVATSYGESPQDTVFALEWKGEHTPLKRIKFSNVDLLVHPFHLMVETFKETDDSPLRFKVKANYGTEEDIEIGVSEHLALEEVKPIIESQFDQIRESSKK